MGQWSLVQHAAARALHAAPASGANKNNDAAKQNHADKSCQRFVRESINVHCLRFDNNSIRPSGFLTSGHSLWIVVDAPTRLSAESALLHILFQQTVGTIFFSQRL